MAGGEALLDWMRTNPRDWRLADVERLCAAFGIDCASPRKGSHYKVKHRAVPAILKILTIPAHRPIKPIYVRELVRFVDRVRESQA